MDKLGINVPWLVSQIISFGVMFLILQRYAYKPLLGMMEKRRNEIANALSNAEKIKKDAALKQAELEKQLEATRREGQEAIARATAQSEKVRQDIVAKANEEAAQIKAKAVTDADYERKQALAALQGEIASLSLAVTRKVLGGGGLDEAHHRQLVQQFLSELESA